MTAVFFSISISNLKALLEKELIFLLRGWGDELLLSAFLLRVLAFPLSISEIDFHLRSRDALLKWIEFKLIGCYILISILIFYIDRFSWFIFYHCLKKHLYSLMSRRMWSNKTVVFVYFLFYVCAFYCASFVVSLLKSITLKCNLRGSYLSSRQRHRCFSWIRKGHYDVFANAVYLDGEASLES